MAHDDAPVASFLMRFSPRIVTVASAEFSAEPPRTLQNLSTSSSPAMKTAAGALSEGRPEVAREEFEAIAQSPSAPPFVRGLGMLGMAEAALARQDVPPRSCPPARVLHTFEKAAP